MRKSLVPLLLCLLCSGALVSANAQVSRLQARETEWKNYALPQTNFARRINADPKLLFRVPADWKQQGEELTFTGPHSASLSVTGQKIPEGYPLDDYVASMLQALRDMVGGAESLVTRKTQLQDVDAREIVLEAPDPEGVVIRSSTWVTIRGPHVLVFNLQVPIAHTAEVEPFFKAVVQSVIFLPGDYAKFEAVRNSTIKSPAVGPIHEAESIVAALNETTSAREPAIARLASLFSSTPDVAIDLLLDSRPLVRAAAVEGLARSNNGSLTPFLWELLDDRDPLVAETVARKLANSPDIVSKTLEHSLSGFRTEVIARVWPFMTKEKRNELLQVIFKETAVPRTAPPPVRAVPKAGVTVSVGRMAPVQREKPMAEIVGVMAAQDPNVQLGALTLLISVPRDEFKLPLARLMASNYNPLIAVGLQVALARGETLPVASLLKLVSSSDDQVSRLAAQNLGFSAGVTEVPLVEALVSRDGSRKALDDELKLSIKKIKFRHDLSTAKTESEQRETLNKALSDAALADFAWRYNCEASEYGCTPGASSAGPPRELSVKPFAENLFPKKVRHYTAIPNPRQAVQKFHQTLNSLQMDSPRDQANLVLVMGNIRRLLGRELSAPPDAESLIDYTGIDPDSPIVLGSWTAENAPDRTAVAQRKAIVLRVKDRARFERTLEQLQGSAAGVSTLTDVVAIGTRAIAALPAILPLNAQAVLATEGPKKDKTPLLRYSTIGSKEWNGLRMKTIEHTWINTDWTIQGSTTLLAYLGDTVILAPDLATIRDLLMNANAATNRQSLADNPEFRQAIDSQGDVVYFSDLRAVLAGFGNTNSDAASKINERGALKFSSSSWENFHQLVFDESDWSKPLLPFHPKELTAPRELLPASTIAYYLTKVDLPALWSTSSKSLFSKLELEALPNVWALDFKQDVLPELGPECGAAVIELPNLNDFRGGTVAIFCKLRSNKLSEALTAGKLFRGVGPTSDVAELKVGADSFFFAARNGFLVLSNRAKGLAVLDRRTNLAATRDYSRSVEKVPGNVVAFGGYNLSAAVAAATNNAIDGHRANVANVILSLASAFHSQNFYATASSGTVEARSSVSMDREGRYAVADFSYLPRGPITYAVIEPGGVPITNQKGLSKLVLRVRARAPGPIDNIKEDIKSADQVVEQKSATELLVTVAARRPGAEKAIQLPVKDPELAPYLKATAEFAADKKEVVDQARKIAGDDRDAWSVALKLADWTHKNLEWKLVLRADAVQTLATREADCSEFSALFVAMARSLGLPARMVSGLAYTGSSFGGHAWVEVWIGRWIELDPTWGTSFVDATHIRNATNTLLTSAALNLIDLEVLEATRSVAEFQKTPRALAQHLAKSIPLGAKSEIEAAIDIATLTDEHMGAGAWAKLSERERDQMWSAYRRVVHEIVTGYGSSESEDEFDKPSMRLLHVQEKADTAEAIYLYDPGDLLLKSRFVRRNDVWQFVEVVHTDTGFAVATETLSPVVSSIEKVRAGEKPSAMLMSGFSRVLLLLEQDAGKAIALVDELLKANPKHQSLRYLKALALLGSDKTEEAKKLLTELSNEAFAPAVYKLGGYLSDSEDEQQQQQLIDLYLRYTSLEPHDPRGFRDLGDAYNALEKTVDAEAAYRKAIEIDPGDIFNYRNLIEFFLVRDRVNEVRPLLVAAEKYKQPDEDLFGSIMYDLYMTEEPVAAEKFAASEPLRMKTSADANLALGRIYVDAGRYREAERFLNAAAQLEPKNTGPYISLAVLYRRQSRWLAALKAADQAIKINERDSEAHYQRACALARLRRINDAMAALTKSVEIGPLQSEYIADEADLKPLASLPAFKKLLPKPEKPQPPQP